MYRAEKNFSGLVSRTMVQIKENVRVEFFIWESAEAMKAGGINADLDEKIAACCVSPGWKVCLQDGKRVVDLPEVFAEIHLVHECYGGGVYAHELQHLILFWIEANDLDWMEKDAEAICDLAGRITTEFWNWYYDPH